MLATYMVIPLYEAEFFLGQEWNFESCMATDYSLSPTDRRFFYCHAKKILLQISFKGKGVYSEPWPNDQMNFKVSFIISFKERVPSGDNKTWKMKTVEFESTWPLTFHILKGQIRFKTILFCLFL
jgi:hypothetical protein